MGAERAPREKHKDERDRRRGGPRGGPVLDAALRERAAGGDRTATAVLDAAGGGTVQAKLEVGRADDPWERAADQAADAALRRLRGDGTGATAPPGDPGGVRRSALSRDARGGGDATAEEERAIRGGGGAPLPSRVRERMERAFDADLSSVRVHDDARAHRLAEGLQATAFTAGSDIWFGRGAFDPDSPKGERVLAHELAHVVQQGHASPAPVRRLMSYRQFKASTATTGHRRGDALRAIDKHFQEYERLTAEYGKGSQGGGKAMTKGKGSTGGGSGDDSLQRIANLQRRIKLLEEMEEMAKLWMQDHSIETTLPDPSAPAPAPAPAAPQGGPTRPAPPAPPAPPGPSKRVIEDPKRKRRMDGLRVFVYGGAYQHEKNKSDEDVAEKSGIRSLAEERQSLQMTLLSLKAAVGSDKASTVGPVEDSKRIKKIRQKYSGDAKSMLTSLAPLVNASIPNNGDEVEIDLEAKVPVDPDAIGFILFHLVLTASRDSVAGEVAGSEGHQNVVLRGELTVGGGVNVADIAVLKAELGLYAESSSNTAEGALTLFSYGMYRRWRESKAVSSGLVSFLYSGRTGEFGYQKSEAWANQVEKEQFSDTTTPSGQKEKNDAYVETGILGRVSGKVGKEIGGVGTELEGSLTFGGGRRYDKASIERAKGKGNLGAANLQSKDRTKEATSKGGNQLITADDTFYFEIAGSFAITPVSGGFTITGKFSRPGSKKLRTTDELKKWKTDSVELLFEGAFEMPMVGFGPGMASKVIRPAATALLGLPGVIRTIVEAKKKEMKKAKDKAARGAGTAIDSVTASIPTLTQYLKQLGEEDNWTEFSTDLSDATGPEVGSSASINVSIGFDFTEKELTIEFSTSKNIEVEIPLFFEGSISKTKRILAITISGDGVQVS